MVMVKIRNNSQRVIGFPAIGTPDGSVKGPLDAINIAPGETREIDTERLKQYESPALMAKFQPNEDGRRADLEILQPSTPTTSMKDMLSQYDATLGSKPATAPDPSVTLGAVTPGSGTGLPRGGQGQTGNVPGDSTPVSAVDLVK